MPNEKGRAIATLVLDLYYILVDASQHDATGGTSSLDADDGISPKRETSWANDREPTSHLLPFYNGWYMTPDYPFPLPVNRTRAIQRREENRFFPRRRYWGWLAQLDGLRAVEQRVRNRAKAHHIAWRTSAILRHAVREAEIEWDNATIAAGQSGAELDFLIQSRGFPLDQIQEAEREYHIALRKARLSHLRLHWLQLWEEDHAERIIGNSRRMGAGVSPGKYDRLIKPRDVEEASELMQPVLIGLFADGSMSGDDISSAQQDLVGLWYASMLWQCGATWRDLAAIRRRYRMPGRRRYRSWADIAEMKRRRLRADAESVG